MRGRGTKNPINEKHIQDKLKKRHTSEQKQRKEKKTRSRREKEEEK